MPIGRVPQNSAKVSHCNTPDTRCKLLTDLQAVYQKIIPTGSHFQLIANDNPKSRTTMQVSKARRGRLGRHESRRLYSSNSSFFNHRVPSASQSVEEIVITPLSVSDREDVQAVKSRRYSTPTSINTKCIASEDHGAPVKPDNVRVSTTQPRARSSINFSTSEYSEQSIRYVAEQVAIEQARQLKLRSNPQQHRIDRKYFVCGSRLPIQTQTFEEEHKLSLKQTGNSKALSMMNKNGRIKSPPCRRINATKAQIFTLSRHTVVGSRIQSASLKEPASARRSASLTRSSSRYSSSDRDAGRPSPVTTPPPTYTTPLVTIKPITTPPPTVITPPQSESPPPAITIPYASMVSNTTDVSLLQGRDSPELQSEENVVNVPPLKVIITNDPR